jgi:LmbE family N-acetylglucosaminyl deacetylase
MLSHPESWGRVLLVAAHPDDEVLALGGHFRTVHPRIFHLTDGAGFLPFPNLAERRGKETKRALAIGGIPRRRFTSGTVPDQGVVDAIPPLMERLMEVIKKVRADCLLTHAYEGGHPDHDAASLVCHLAAGSIPVYEFPGYYNGTPHLALASWAVSRFLPADTPEIVISLSPRQRQLKRRMLRCFSTQAEFLRRFPLETERFRLAPPYRFDKPPHDGPLLYETFGWPVDYDSWRIKAAKGIKLIGKELNEQT